MSNRLLFLALIALFFACNPEDEILTDPSAMLSFSVDTLRFDTVFTELGSATRFVKVYNNNDSRIRINQIRVKSAGNTKFRFNVDGIPGSEFDGVEIAANDSIYIFSEVTINPDQDISISPFVLNDALEFETNGNRQEVVLEAWGQNANYFPNRFYADSIFAIGCGNDEINFDDPKPYVIYGIVFFDECTINIPAGARIYVHGGLGTIRDENDMRQFYNDGRIIIGPNANVNITGTQENPVIIQGDRLEEGFEDVEGQWFGMIFSAGSTGNVIEHTTIKNSLIGIVVDSSASLVINNSQIYNTTSSALLAIHAEVSSDNSLFYNNAGTSIRLIHGGDYEFNYSTITSFGVDASGLELANLICYDSPFCQSFNGYRLNATFNNSIIYGSRADQIVLNELNDVGFNYDFNNCIVRIKDLLEDDQYPNFLDDCDNCISANPGDALFAEIDEDNFHLDTLSIAEMMAAPISGLELDLDGVERDTDNPDIGCFEYVYE